MAAESSPKPRMRPNAERLPPKSMRSPGATPDGSPIILAFRFQELPNTDLLDNLLQAHCGTISPVPDNSRPVPASASDAGCWNRTPPDFSWLRARSSYRAGAEARLLHLGVRSGIPSDSKRDIFRIVWPAFFASNPGLKPPKTDGPIRLPAG